MEKDKFLDRAYWEKVTIERDAAGQLSGLVYDQFHGNAVKPN